MAKSLYEILEVNPKASKEAIDAAYSRLAEKFNPEAAENRGKSDAVLQYKAVREAYGILGNPDRRLNYDRTHPAPGVVVRPSYSYASDLDRAPPFWNLQRALVAIVVVIAAGLLYFRIEHDREAAALERARIAAEKKLAQDQLAAEQEKAAQDFIERRAQQARAAQEQYELRRFTQEVNRNEREREYAQAAATRREEYEKRMDEQRQQAQERAAAARAKAEVAELERKMRQREMEDRYRRPNVYVIPDPRQQQ